jgi:uncharacterized membrane protein YraQ (UPF0718 family)
MTEGEGAQRRIVPTSAAVSLGEFVETTIQGKQTFSQEQSEFELKAETEAHKRAMELAEHQLKLEERRKDNDLRRFCFKLVLFLLIGVLVTAALVAVFNSDADTRKWAQGIVTVLVSSLLGGIVGYFTGKAGA